MGDAKSVGESLGEDCADPAAAPLVGTRLPITLGGQLVGPPVDQARLARSAQGFRN